ncbi:TlyA family RNA methyltransferase [Micrococcus sp. FDAARGOS_333]|uniref:TlyA family RNA methyltransferase n=1 Tax=Micrococcus sp. FDAARGOS_333 TaxID=1930558 RepID=UPI000B4E598C|nr:TlyA family RNA methyltransferase [Micrococcus sp. FDAARGOS_333]PNL18222.1 TlyA family RNA methyltransferase [Micrococcus sp. FDAARGOS_333]
MRVRADVALAERGLARSRTEAAALIKSGLVLADGRPVARASQRVLPTTALTVADDGPRYVSRAAHKLVSALDAFPDVAVAGRRCLDAGACTGGFTHVLLERDAAHVAAVDVGHGQLHEVLRTDDRVLVREGLNVRTLVPEDVGGPVELVVSDLSFISLRLVVDALAGVCVDGADLLLMVKPQFEVGKAALPKSGVVTDPADRRRAVAGVLEAAAAAGLAPRGLARSGLPGQDGNVEFFLHLRRTDAPASAVLEDVPGHADVDWA